MKNVDFLIIGGGIAGVSAAARLAPHGTTALLEAETSLAYHASGRSAALYEPHYGPPAIVELSLASGAELGAMGVLSPRGVMLVAAPEEIEAFDAEADQMNMPLIDPEAAVAAFPALDPARVARAAKADHAQDIDTDLLIQTHRKTARSHGAEILTSAPVSAVTRQGGRWQVTSGQGEFSARVLVNAAGAWADVIARMAGVAPLGIQPKRRSMARIPAPGGLDVSGWPMLLGMNEGWYAKPDAGAMIVSPSEADPAEPHDAWPDDMVLAEGLARYEAMMRFPVTRMIASWAGLRSFAPDGSPAYGRDSDQPDFIWFAGQGGYGFQSSAAAASFIADTVLGRPTDAALARRLDPARFR